MLFVRLPALHHARAQSKQLVQQLASACIVPAGHACTHPLRLTADWSGGMSPQPCDGATHARLAVPWCR